MCGGFAVDDDVVNHSILIEPEANSGAMEDDEEEVRAGQQRMMGYAVKRVLMELRSKGRPLEAASATMLLEMADRGEIENTAAVQQLRAMVLRLTGI